MTLRLLQCLSYVNSEAVNTGVHVSFWIRIFSRYLSRSGISKVFLKARWKKNNNKGKVREGHDWLLQTSWCRNPLFMQLSPQVSLQCSCKSPTRQLLFSVLYFLISIWKEQYHTLKCQSLENQLSCIFPEEGNGNPLQYSCLENPMDGGAWWAIDHGVTKSQTQPSD